jgi:hypothetical protein
MVLFMNFTSRVENGSLRLAHRPARALAFLDERMPGDP